MTEKLFYPDYDRFDREYVPTGHSQPSSDGIVDEDLNNPALATVVANEKGHLQKIIDRKAPKSTNSFAL